MTDRARAGWKTYLHGQLVECAGMCARFKAARKVMLSPQTTKLLLADATALACLEEEADRCGITILPSL